MARSRPAVRCRARRSDGTPCAGYAIVGGTVCRAHGGAAAQVRTAADQRSTLARVEGQVVALLDALEVEAVHPLDGLLEAVQRAGGMMRLLGQLLGRLHITDNGSGEALYGPDHLGNARPHVLLALYGQWVDRYARACKLALDAGVDERMLRLAESDADRLFTAITGAMETAGLSLDQREAFRVALVAELRAV
jgi:hypothetical protein